jgi:hypothetical protein
VRAFVQLREVLASNKELARRFAQLETRLDKKLTTHDEAIADWFHRGSSREGRATRENLTIFQQRLPRIFCFTPKRSAIAACHPSLVGPLRNEPRFQEIERKLKFPG